MVTTVFCHYVVNVRYEHEGRERDEVREFELIGANNDLPRTVEVRLVMSPILWTGADGTRYRDRCYKWVKGNETKGGLNRVSLG